MSVIFTYSSCQVVHAWITTNRIGYAATSVGAVSHCGAQVLGVFGSLTNGARIKNGAANCAGVTSNGS